MIDDRPLDATDAPVRGVRDRFDRWSGAVALAVIGSRALTVAAYLVSKARGHTNQLGAWDAGHYLRIAAIGYPPALQSAATRGSDWAFFPLFPLATRGVHSLTSLSFQWSGIVVNSLADVILGVALWRLAILVMDRRSAMWANVLFWLFPGSAVLSMNYSEPLFLALAALSLWWLVERRWLLAGAAASLSWTARPAGVAVAAACLVAAAVAIWKDRDWRSVLAPIFAPIGLIVFLLYSSARTGHWNEWRRAEAGWHQTFDFSDKLPRMLSHSWSGPSANRPEHVVLGIGLVFFIACMCVAGRRLLRLPAPLVAYFVVLFVLTFGSSHVSSRPRFLLVMLPLFFALGMRLRNRPAVVLACLEAVCLPILLFLYVSAPHFVP
jgi:Mannosyltransferase (PIG-V)